MDVDEIQVKLQEEGYCVVRGAIAPAEARRLDERTRAVVDELGDAYISLEGALNDLPELAGLCTHALVMDVAERVLGSGFLLANNVAIKLCKPGTQAGGLHADWPVRAVAAAPPGSLAPPWGGLQVFFMLRDATAENGATRVVPFSHHLQRPPTRTEYPQETPVVGKAGDMFLFHNQLWHRSGQNTTTDDYRNLANIFYIPGSLHRPPEAWPLVKRAVYDTFDKRLQQLLARSVEA